jgi:hypothetical protein
MVLTRKQHELLKEVEAIAALTKLDYHMIEEAESEAHSAPEYRHLQNDHRRRGDALHPPGRDTL